MEAVQPDGYPWELLILLFVTVGITRKGRKMLRNTFYQSNSIMDGSWVHRREETSVVTQYGKSVKSKNSTRPLPKWKHPFVQSALTKSFQPQSPPTEGQT